MGRDSTPTRPEVICQVCGGGNPEEAEHCRACRAPLYIVSGSDRGEDFFEAVPSSVELEDRLRLLEERERELRSLFLKLSGEMEHQGKGLSILQGGVSTLRDLLRDKGLFDDREWTERWERVLADQFFLMEQRDKLLRKRDAIVGAFRGRDLRGFTRALDNALFHLTTQGRGASLEALETALALDGRNVEILAFLGGFHLQGEDLPQAARRLAQALAIAPDHAESLFLLGLLKALQGDPGGAVTLLESVKETAPQPFLVHYTLGTLYASMHRHDRAEMELRAAVEAEPQPSARAALASVLYSRDRTPEALPLLETLSLERQADPEALFLLGLCYLDRNRPGKARRVLRELTRTGPARWKYQQALALAEGWNSIPAVPPEAPAATAVRRAEAALAASRPEAAWKAYGRVRAALPRHPLALLGQALLAHRTGRHAACHRACKGLLKRGFPEVVQVPAWAALMASLREAGRPAALLPEAQRMASRVRSPYGKCLAYAAWAGALADLDRHLDDALDLAETALHFAPEELASVALESRGRVLCALGRSEDGVRDYREALRQSPSATVLELLGKAEQALGRTAEAREARRASKRLGPVPDSLPWRLWHALKLEIRRKWPCDGPAPSSPR